MPLTFGTIHVRRRRGKLVLIGQGKTGRGQNYVKRAVDIGHPTMPGPDFKRKLAEAVVKLFDSEA